MKQTTVFIFIYIYYKINKSNDYQTYGFHQMGNHRMNHMKGLSDPTSPR